MGNIYMTAPVTKRDANKTSLISPIVLQFLCKSQENERWCRCVLESIDFAIVSMIFQLNFGTALTGFVCLSFHSHLILNLIHLCELFKKFYPSLISWWIEDMISLLLVQPPRAESGWGVRWIGYTTLFGYKILASKCWEELHHFHV